MAARQPRRTCVGCGRVAPKPELLRIVAIAQARSGKAGRRTVALDPHAALPGRGAYLCRDTRTGGPAPACLERARKRGGIARALRCAVTVPDRLVVESPEDELAVRATVEPSRRATPFHLSQ